MRERGPAASRWARPRQEKARRRTDIAHHWGPTTCGRHEPYPLVDASDWREECVRRVPIFPRQFNLPASVFPPSYAIVLYGWAVTPSSSDVLHPFLDEFTRFVTLCLAAGLFTASGGCIILHTHGSVILLIYHLIEI